MPGGPSYARPCAYGLLRGPNQPFELTEGPKGDVGSCSEAISLPRDLGGAELHVASRHFFTTGLETYKASGAPGGPRRSQR